MDVSLQAAEASIVRAHQSLSNARLISHLLGAVMKWKKEELDVMSPLSQRLCLNAEICHVCLSLSFAFVFIACSSLKSASVSAGRN